MGERAALEIATRTRRAALVVVGSCALCKDTARANCLSHSTRSRGAACQLRLPRISRLVRGTRERATALAVSREEAQHSSLQRTRAVPRWLWPYHVLGKVIAPVRGHSHLVRGRGVTCQLQPPRISRLSRGTRERATALAVSRDEAQHASLQCTRALSRWLWLAYVLDKATALARGLSLIRRAAAV